MHEASDFRAEFSANVDAIKGLRRCNLYS